MSLLHARVLFVLLAAGSIVSIRGQQREAEQLPDEVRAAQQLVSQGKLSDALVAYRRQLKDSPDSVPLNMGIGIVLDLMGHGPEARKYLSKALDLAETPQAKAGAQRAIAMSYAFEGDCRKTVKAQQPVVDYYISTGDTARQAEMANEAARACIDSGDLDTAEKWYTKGRDAGLKQAGIRPDAIALWNFRWEHAQARLAARRGKADEAHKHVAAAKALLDSNPAMAKAQAVFYPYLTGYVAFYFNDYKTALEEFKKANQGDPFIHCLMGQTYEKMGQQEKATECYEKALAATAHNPNTAYAHRIARKKLAR